MNTKTKKKVNKPPPSTSDELSDSELNGIVGGTPGRHASTPPKKIVCPDNDLGSSSELIISAGPGAGAHV